MILLLTGQEENTKIYKKLRVVSFEMSGVQGFDTGGFVIKSRG